VKSTKDALNGSHGRASSLSGGKMLKHEIEYSIGLPGHHTVAIEEKHVAIEKMKPY
jgi:hypothetical protein